MKTEENGQVAARPRPDLSKYKALLFDMDGTLISSADNWYGVYSGYLRHFGKEIPDKAELLNRMHAGLMKAAESETEASDTLATALVLINEHYGINADLEETGRVVHSLIEVHMREGAIMYPGVAEFLKKVKASGVPIYLVTAASLRCVELMLGSDAVADLVDYREIFGQNIITAGDVRRIKPNPECFLLASANLGVDIADCLIFEDSDFGMKAAVASGADVCLVLQGQEKRKALREMADFEIDGFNDLVE